MSNPLKKTMVYLGLAEEAEDVVEDDYAAPAKREEPKAPVTPLRRPVAVREPAAAAIAEILTVHPKQYRDAQIIAENFREGIPVIINLSQMSDADARRLVDFASGLALGLYGRIERVTNKVFLLSPEAIALSGDGSVTQSDPDAVPFAQQ